jgi:energy-converting hydrogenase Eha subunit A
MGLTHAQPGRVSWPVSALFCFLAMAVWLLVSRGKLRWAVLSTAAATVVGVVWLAGATFPLLDRTVSARAVWREVEAHRGEVCVAGVNRGWRYTLNYYSVTPLPDCGVSAGRLRIEQSPGLAPHPVPSTK